MKLKVVSSSGCHDIPWIFLVRLRLSRLRPRRKLKSWCLRKQPCLISTRQT